MSRRDTPLDEFAILLKNPSHDLTVPLYDKHKGRHTNPVKTSKSKYTLNQIGDALFAFIKTTNDRFCHLENRVDKGFKQVNARIDRIEERLDYNNLKPLPRNK